MVGVVEREEPSKEEWEEYTAILYEIRRLGEMMDASHLNEAKTVLIAATQSLHDVLEAQDEGAFT